MTKTCFIVSPIGDEGSEVRRRSDQVLRYIIRPAAEAAGYQCIRADEISVPGNITSQLLSHLAVDDLVIADLTGHNPNVFYELGIRHAIGKPVLHIIERDDRIPFDIASFRTIILDHRDLESAEKAKHAIQEAIVAIEQTPDAFESPVDIAKHLRETRDYQRLAIRAYVKDNSGDTEKISEAIRLLSEALNLSIISDPPAESGSWFKKWFAKTSEAVTQPEVAERLRRVERAIELQALHKPQSEIDNAQASATKALITALEHVENAAIQVGSILLVKTTRDSVPSVVVRTLTVSELQLLETNPRLLSDPSGVLDAISTAQQAAIAQGTLTLETDG